MITAIIFIIVLSILVFVHELGHFIVAKRAGMKVEEFGFGFPPRAFGIKRGETIYSINWVPFGGFVKYSAKMARRKVIRVASLQRRPGSKSELLLPELL